MIPVSLYDSNFELSWVIFVWQCICILTTWCVSLCLSWHHAHAVTLSIMLPNADIATMCVCVNHCVSIVTMYDYLSPCMCNASVFMLRCYVSMTVMIKLSQCVFPCSRCYKSCLSQLLSALTRLVVKMYLCVGPVEAPQCFIL